MRGPSPARAHPATHLPAPRSPSARPGGTAEPAAAARPGGGRPWPASFPRAPPSGRRRASAAGLPPRGNKAKAGGRELGARGGAPRRARPGLCPCPLPCPEAGVSPRGSPRPGRVPAAPPVPAARPERREAGRPRAPRGSAPGPACGSLTLVDSAGSRSFPGETGGWSCPANVLARRARLAWRSGHCTVA